MNIYWTRYAGRQTPELEVRIYAGAGYDEADGGHEVYGAKWVLRRDVSRSPSGSSRGQLGIWPCGNMSECPAEYPALCEQVRERLIAWRYGAVVNPWLARGRVSVTTWVRASRGF